MAKDAAGLAKHWSYQGWLAYLEAKVKGQPGHLQPGSNPAVLPGPVLIADRNNSRVLLVDPKGRILWQFPAPGNLTAGQTFLSPDDAFFGPHGRHLVITQESQFVITVVSLRTGHITWRYGHPTVAGLAPGYLDNPDDAMLLPNGNVMAADIKNCRLLELSRFSSIPLHVYGITDPYCLHQPPTRFGSPNGMFPMSNGNWLVTEINGDWVDEMTPSGRILWSVHPPGISYPSDTNQVSSNVFLTAAYTNPGVVEEFNSSGQLLWRYAPVGAAALNRPSLALPLPNGDVLLNDDWNHRVIVVDPRTNQVVWQYGVTGVPGSAPGYLNKPDGVDLAPPYSLLMTHAATMGTPPFTSG
ncbi:MAG: outer membrane protein assembly factor BamB family protein [Acidimicrobiales bacterium]